MKSPFPITLEISVTIPSQTNAVDCVADLIDLEIALRKKNGQSGFVPISHHFVFSTAQPPFTTTTITETV